MPNDLFSLQTGSARCPRHAVPVNWTLYENSSHAKRSEVTEVWNGKHLRRKKMFSEISVSSNKVGVIVNATVFEFPKVSFSIRPAVVLAGSLRPPIVYRRRKEVEINCEYFLTASISDAIFRSSLTYAGMAMLIAQIIS